MYLLQMNFISYSNIFIFIKYFYFYNNRNTAFVFYYYICIQKKYIGLFINLNKSLSIICTIILFFIFFLKTIISRINQYYTYSMLF